jgi:hypothetical protein
MGRGDETLVRVASAGNQALGEMWREVLANNGIPCLLRIVGPLTGYASFASPHDLFVRAADADRAREFLAAFNEDEGDLALGRDAGDEGAEADYWMEGAAEPEVGDRPTGHTGERGEGRGRGA